MTAGYSGTPLPRKLGIKEESRVLLLSAPADLALGPLPPRSRVHRRRGAGAYDVIAAFCPDQRSLGVKVAPLVEALSPAGRLWICWPKRASGRQSDLGEAEVRTYGLALGLVDIKVAAIDLVWSGLMFVRRVGQR